MVEHMIHFDREIVFQCAYGIFELFFPFLFKDLFLCLYRIFHVENDEFNVILLCVDEPLHSLLHVTHDVAICLLTELAVEILFSSPPLFFVDCYQLLLGSIDD